MSDASAVPESVRALLLTPDGTVLLVRLSGAGRWSGSGRDLWITPGGRIETGESHKATLLRELKEEVARGSFTIGPLVWIREATFRREGAQILEREYFYLIRTERFEPDPSRNPALAEREITKELRWWRIPDLEHSGEEFAPVRIAALLRDLIENGPPAEPLRTGP